MPRGRAPIPDAGHDEERTRVSANRPVANSAPRPPAAPIPEESHAGGSTKTQRVVATLQRDNVLTFSLVGACAVFGFGAIWLYSNGWEVLAVIVALAIIPTSLTALFVRRAPCPRCGKPIIIIGLDQCDGCREYIRVEGNVLKVVEVGYIADQPTFELSVPLPLVPRITFATDSCCVCGGRSAATERLEVQENIIEISHCGSHPGGIIWSIGLVSEAIPMVTFKFRSFDYFTAVREANSAHVRAGMWR